MPPAGMPGRASCASVRRLTWRSLSLWAVQEPPDRPGSQPRPPRRSCEGRLCGAERPFGGRRAFRSSGDSDSICERLTENLEIALVNSDVPVPIYLDQNVFSRMQEGAVERESILDLLKTMSSKGAVFVYSMIHVDECRASDQPEVFVDIIEGISASFLEQSNPTDTKITLSTNRARELILAELDIVDEATRRIEDLLKPLHFVAGWLDEIEAKALQTELAEGVHLFWKSLENELPREMLSLLERGKAEMLKSIREMPLEQMKDESHELGKRFRECLPKNYAQLGAVPDDVVVEYLFSRLHQNEQAEIRNIYPPLFWADIQTREEGRITGFTFLLFIMGVVRDPRVKRKDRERREKYFLGQFRDCQHIEAATRCAMFLTFDKGAARLAKAAYAYAGVGTQVVCLEVRRP